MMADAELSAASTAAAEWRAEAAKRRQISHHDPVADTLEYCAVDLAERVRVFCAINVMCTCEQYAARHNVTPQTVRGWIKRGELHATRTPHGWQIPQTARRARKRGGETLENREGHAA
jgi:hypothetical protein